MTIAYESYGPEDRETMLLVMGQGAQLTTWPVELCEDRRPKLKTIKAPTVVLHGAEDPIVPVEGAETWRRIFRVRSFGSSPAWATTCRSH